MLEEPITIQTPKFEKLPDVPKIFSLLANIGLGILLASLPISIALIVIAIVTSNPVLSLYIITGSFAFGYLFASPSMIAEPIYRASREQTDALINTIKASPAHHDKIGDKLIVVKSHIIHLDKEQLSAKEYNLLVDWLSAQSLTADNSRTIDPSKFSQQGSKLSPVTSSQSPSQPYHGMLSRNQF